MALTNAFYEAVKSGNVRRVRIMMKNSLLIDPTFEEFHAMEKAASSMVGLYDKHDGKEFIEDRNLWDNNYMDKVMVKVISNFSHERLDHLKEVVHYLMPVTKSVPSKQKSINQTNSESKQKVPYQEEKRRCQEQGDYLGAKVGAGAFAGAVVAVSGGIIVSLAGATAGGVLGSAAFGALVGGGITALIVNGGKSDE